ncbi:MAG: hypothetical protein LBG26_05875 [Treponema sp.]|nr:hypothetical protein [Treponema sp.]
MPGYEGLSFEKVWAMFQETDKKFQETDRKFQETDRRFRGTDRKFQDTFQEDDRKLFGAVAAAIIPDNVHDFALKNGFYVIRQSGDNISIEEPQNKPRAW